MSVLRHDTHARMARPAALAPLQAAMATRAETPASEIDLLRAEIARLESVLEDREVAHARALEAAVEEARAEAARAHRRDDAAALGTLTTALGSLSARLDEKLGGVETLALNASELALANVFDPPADMMGLVSRAIRKQVSEVRAELVLAVAVSPADFPDPEALTAVAASAPGARIQIDDALASGACRLDLRLGRIDLSLPQHWAELRDRLRQLADHAKAATP